MQRPRFGWPSKDDYNMAMEDINHTIKDKDISRGSIQKDNTSILSYGGANLYATLYHIDNWMVRCFCKTPQREPPPDILKRYQFISDFIQRMSYVPALVPITYVANGIRVEYLDRSGDSFVLIGTDVLPFIKMPFIYGQSLGSFIFTNHTKQDHMFQLCAAWLQLISDLERIQMAHGDLDLTNILVSLDKNVLITLKLIDYDNTWIPDFTQGYEQTEGGHEHFQHPAFSRKSTRPFNAFMDRFSALVIYISLRALVYSPELYIEWGADDTHRLLLAKKDYEAEIEGKPNHITRLREKHIPELEPLLSELSLCLEQKRMPCRLKDLVTDTSSQQVPNTIVNIEDWKPHTTEQYNQPTPGKETEEVFYKWEEMVDLSANKSIPQYIPEQYIPVTDMHYTVQDQSHSQQQYIDFSAFNTQKSPNITRRRIITALIFVVFLAILIALFFATHTI